MKHTELEHLFNDLYRQNFAFAMKLTRDENEAKDLMQETALKVFSNLDKFEKDSNFKAWVSTILRNNFISHYRKINRRKKLECSMEDYFSISENAYCVNQGPANLRYLELQMIIDKIEDNLKDPFILYQQGYAYQEIADQLEVPIGTIKSRIFFARKRLKGMLENVATVDYKKTSIRRNKFLKAS